jgi:hypothetical protein
MAVSDPNGGARATVVIPAEHVEHVRFVIGSLASAACGGVSIGDYSIAEIDDAITRLQRLRDSHTRHSGCTRAPH